MEKVRVGVVGLGNIGSVHAVGLFEGHAEEMVLGAVCDSNELRRKWAKEKLGETPVYEDFDNMISEAEIDAVIIAVPHYFHVPMAIKAFEKGLNVLTEKPAGVQLSEVFKMNAAAEKSGKVFGIMWNQRTSPLYAKVRELLADGVIGTPARLIWNITNWYRTQEYYDSGSWRATWTGEGGGVLMNQAPHNIDLWQWIFGMPKRIRAFCYNGKYHNIEVEDDATIFAEYENGATASFITSTGEYPGTNKLEIAGSKGKLLAESGKIRLWIAERPDGKVNYSELDMSMPESGHMGILRDFASAILHGTPLLASGYEGVREIEIVNAAYLSSWTDSWAELPLDTEAFDRELHSRQLNSVTKKSGGECVGSETYLPRWSVNR